MIAFGMVVRHEVANRVLEGGLSEEDHLLSVVSQGSNRPKAIVSALVTSKSFYNYRCPTRMSVADRIIAEHRGVELQEHSARDFIHLHVVKSRDASCVAIRHARLRQGGSWSTGIHSLDGYAVDAARTSWARRRAAPGEIPMKRLNARLNAASDW